MKRLKDKVELTLKEAEPLYDREAKNAGRIGNKLFKLLKQ